MCPRNCAPGGIIDPIPLFYILVFLDPPNKYTRRLILERCHDTRTVHPLILSTPQSQIVDHQYQGI